MRRIGIPSLPGAFGGGTGMEREIPFKIDRKSGLPIHLQLKRNVSYLISSGYWKKSSSLHFVLIEDVYKRQGHVLCG